MAELIILLIGAVISALLALLKIVGIWATLSWLGVCVPLIIAAILITGCWCGFDFTD